MELSGSVITSFSNLEGDEMFDGSTLGTAAEVEEIRVSDDDFILVKVSPAATHHSHST